METPKIRVTTNYDIFKKLQGNRELNRDRNHVKRLADSMKQIGYNPAFPIVVNEKMEVVDGQHRLAAARLVSVPIYYVVEHGVDPFICATLNTGQREWKLIDFIHLYAERGYSSYKYLDILCQRYVKTFPIKTIIQCLSGCGVGTDKAEETRNGLFRCTESDYNRAIMELEWLKTLIPLLKRCGGALQHSCTVLMVCYDDPEIDNDRLVKKMYAYEASMIPVATALQAADQIEKAYNYRSRDKVYIAAKYRKAVDEAHKRGAKITLEKRRNTQQL